MLDDRLTILIIDDDPVDRAIYRRYLEESGAGNFTFFEAATGQAGIALSAEINPDCILLDVSLPDINGVAVLHHLRNGASTLPFAVVMLTAIGNQQTAVEAMKLGVMDYVAKGPSAGEALPRTVCSAIHAHKLNMEIERQRAALEERHAALQAMHHTLVAEKERYRTLTEAIPQLVWTADATGAIAYANTRMQDFAGWVAGERWNLMALLPEEDRSRLREAWNTSLENQDPIESEVRLRRAADGSYRRHLLRAVPLAGTGTVGQWTGTCTDVEDHKRAEEAVRQQQKLDSIGLLAGGIAHDFNNLLVGILLGASHTLDALEPDHPVRDMLMTIVRSSERAAHLTRQLLAYAGKAEIVVEPVDIPRVLEDTCELVRVSMPKTVQLRWEADPMPLIETSPAQVQQVVMNLVINAAEAIGRQRGTVTVRATRTTVGGNGPFLNRLGYKIFPGEYVEITVTDTGCGMNEETIGRIFDPFFTTKFTGRGLGLAAVQGVLRSLGGSIEVASAVNQGSTFRLIFPAKRASRIPYGVPRGSASASPASILVIDDEEVVRKTVRVALEYAGHTILCAPDGKTGLALFEQYRDQLGLVLLDFGMPNMSGTQVLRELRKRRLNVPVAIMSAYSEREIHTQFLGEQYAGYIEKPFTAQAFAAAVSGLLAQNSQTSRTNI